jgi:thymidine kinase
MSLTLYLGPVCASKTTFAIGKYLKKSYKRNGVIFMNKMDKRYGDSLVAHNKIFSIKENLHLVDDGDDIKNFISKNRNISIVLIDEIHFMGDAEKFKNAIEFLLELGIDILATGINGDYMRRELPQLSAIIPYATDIKFLKSRCDHCQKDNIGVTSYKVGYNKCCKTPIIIESSKSMFVPLCNKCYYKKIIE